MVFAGNKVQRLSSVKHTTKAIHHRHHHHHHHMLASQLCVFDDETDSKSKWVKKLIVLLCCLPDYLVYFVKISICDALSQFNDDACKVNVSQLNSRN